MSSLIALAIINVVAVVVGQMPEYRAAVGHQGDGVNLIWSAVAIGFLFLAMVLCVDVHRKRRHDRFLIGQEVTVRGGGQVFTAVIDDISLSGMRLKSENNAPDTVEFHWRGIGPILAQKVYATRENSCYRFQVSESISRQLLVEIYTAGFVSSPLRASTRQLLRDAVRRLFCRLQRPTSARPT